MNQRKRKRHAGRGLRSWSSARPINVLTGFATNESGQGPYYGWRFCYFLNMSGDSLETETTRHWTLATISSSLTDENCHSKISLHNFLRAEI